MWQRPEVGDSNPDLWSAGVVLHQLSYQANLELVVVWVDEKPVRMMATNLHIWCQLCHGNRLGNNPKEGSIVWSSQLFNVTRTHSNN